MTDPRATKVSPWQDNLRHLYEVGRSLEDLAFWHSLGKETMRALIVEAGGTIRRGGFQKRTDHVS